MPTMRPSSIRTSSTVKPSRISAPASAAASTSNLSSTVRLAQYATGASLVPGDPESVKGPKSNAYVCIGGHPVAVSRSINPHRARAAAPSGCTTCEDTVSLGNVARSTTSTRYPFRASSIAVGEPAQRAPTMIASYAVFMCALLRTIFLFGSDWLLRAITTRYLTDRALMGDAVIGAMMLRVRCAGHQRGS